MKYYEIDEAAARRARAAYSFTEYTPGSATAEYRRAVDKAAEIATKQKSCVDLMYHEKIDRLLDTYAKKLAENTNKRNAITARVPSVMIAGPANFPVRAKEKQNTASNKNLQEWKDIQGLLDKIRSTGTGGIRGDDPNAIKKLKDKLSGLEQLQETMKAVNAYYRKHKTLDGCPNLSMEHIQQVKAGMENPWGGRAATKPFAAYQLQNNNAEIRRLKGRIALLERNADKATAAVSLPEGKFCGWKFDGGRVEQNYADDRLQIFFDDKPDVEVRAELKSNGFRWAPSVGAWQRQLTNNAMYAVKGMKCTKCIE